MSEEEITAERTQLALERWPHLTDAWGCVNCGILYGRSAEERDHYQTANNLICPACGSESVFDAAAVLNRERPDRASIATAAEQMIKWIDEACEEIPL